MKSIRLVVVYAEFEEWNRRFVRKETRLESVIPCPEGKWEWWKRGFRAQMVCVSARSGRPDILSGAGDAGP